MLQPNGSNVPDKCGLLYFTEAICYVLLCLLISASIVLSGLFHSLRAHLYEVQFHRGPTKRRLLITGVACYLLLLYPVLAGIDNTN